MATITLVANTSYSDLTVADGDTIDLAGFTLNFDVVPTQTGVSVGSPGTAGKVTLGTPNNYPLVGWEFTAGTDELVNSIPPGKTVGGQFTGGSTSLAYAIRTNNGVLTGTIIGSSTSNAQGLSVNYGEITGNVVGGNASGAPGVQISYGNIWGDITGGSGVSSFGVRFLNGTSLGGVENGASLAISEYRFTAILVNGPKFKVAVPSSVRTIYSLFGPLHPDAVVAPGTEVIVLSGDVAAAIANGQRPNQPTRIVPGVAPRLSFCVLDSDGTPVTDLVTAGIASAAYVTITGGVRSSEASITLGSKVADTAAHSTGQLVTVKASEGWYAIDAPVGAALSSADYAELVVVLTDGTRLVYPTLHRIDVAVSTRNAVAPPTVAQLNARTLPTADYFSAATDTVARVTLVDTTSVNTDMRGTDGANTTIPPTAASIASAVWAAGTRTLTAISDSSGVATLLSRITGLLRTKAQADAANDAIPGAVRTELATELAHIDADISSRNATAPNNAGIAAIQADVDALPKYGDTTKRTLVSDGPTELTETITRVP